MLRTVFFLGLIVVAGLMVLGLLFGVAGALIWLVLRILAIGIVVYFIIWLVNRPLAESIKQRLGGRRPPTGW